MFPAAGVASVRDMAAALEVSPEEFASLWNDLPLEDAKVAERLGLTRQQVINLRKSARERLARRTKDSNLKPGFSSLPKGRTPAVAEDHE